MHKKSHLHVWPCCGTQITLQGKCKATISTGTAVTFLSLTNSYCMEVFVCRISLLLTIPKLVGTCWKHPKKSSLLLHAMLNFVFFFQSSPSALMSSMFFPILPIQKIYPSSLVVNQLFQDFMGELLTHHDPSPFPNGQHQKSGFQTSRFPSGLLSGQTSLAGKFPTFPFQSSGLMVNWKWIINRHADLHGAVLVTRQHRDADLRIHQPWLGNPRTKWTVFHGFSWYNNHL